MTSRARQNAPLDATAAARFRRALLRWYDRNCRQLPWRMPPGSRAKPNAYHVLVSEAMLQQTQVSTVIDYYRRFLEAFPTVGALAVAEEQAVLRQWQGLGYYRRARNLHAAAKTIMADHAGRVPDTVAGLSSLPGVGRYTAGAVASIAFGRRVPVVDGNVTRVLTRWFMIDDPVNRADVKAELWRLAERLVPPARPGDFNQALMELGALVCTPTAPACLLCPVSGLCRAHTEGDPQKLPVTGPRRKPIGVEHHVVAIEKAGRFLFEQRPAKGLWSNMWQLPTAESLPQGAKAGRIKDWVADRFGLTLEHFVSAERFTHQTTHRTIGFTVWQGSVASGRLKRGAGVWRRLGRLDDLPLANPQRRCVRLLGERTT